MKKFVILMMLGVAGCQTTSGTGASIADIQRAVKAACAFVPTASTIAALLGKHIPYADIISSVCVAVGATAGTDPAHATFKVKGVTIHGHFIRGD